VGDVLVQPIGDDIGGIAWTCEEHHLLCNVSLFIARKALFSHENSPCGGSRPGENARGVERANPSSPENGHREGERLTGASMD
jgi:hypothetical protein